MSADAATVVAALTLAVADCSWRIDAEPGEQYHLGYLAALLLALDLLTGTEAPARRRCASCSRRRQP